MSEAPVRKSVPQRRTIMPPPSSAIPSMSESFDIVSGEELGGQRILLYGTGGIGKTKLATSMVDVGVNPIFIDVDESIREYHGVKKFRGINSWSRLRAALQAKDQIAPFDAVVVDTLSRAEELCVNHIITSYEGGKPEQGLEGFGYGKGYRFFYDEMMKMLADLDRLHECGKHIIIICHDFKATVSNPVGENYVRYEPMLFSTDKNPLRDKLKGWADHVLFVNYDIAVDDKKKKATGKGVRTIYCQDQPGFLAKSRSLVGPYPFTMDVNTGKVDTTIWKHLFEKE